MKMHDYIRAHDWNSLSIQEQKSLAQALRFLGHRVDEEYIPYGTVICLEVVVIDSDLDLVAWDACWITEQDTPITLEHVRKIIELLPYEVANEG